MDKRFALALGLSLLVWMVWFIIFKPEPRVQQPVDRQTEQAQTEKAVQAPATDRSVTATVYTVPEQKVEDEVELPIETDNYRVKLSNRGARIKSFIYLYNGRQIELIVDKKKLDSAKIQAQSDFDFNVYQTDGEFQNGSPLEKAYWSHQKLTDGSIRFTAVVRTMQGSPMVMEKLYSFHKDKHYFTLEHTIRNSGKSVISLPNNYIIAATNDFLGPDMVFDNTYNRVSSLYYLDDDFEHGSQGGGIFSSEQETVRVNGQVKWIGVGSRYFLTLMVPQGFAGTGVIHEGRNNHGTRTGMYIPVEPIQAGKTISHSFKIYVGEKNKEKLVAVNPVLRDAADVNAFIEPIRDFLLWCLMKINILFGNFGWSLVIFSLITKIILMPLTLKSTESMKRLQELNPKIKEIQSKYKDKPDVMNKKVMELYKKEKVNPLSGCLPLLLQMPFFFALYSALINSIDLWQAPFIFWIQDLSLPDTVLTIPASVAFIGGFNLNILPILMTLTTYLQQKMTPGAGGAQQQMFIKLMPFIFLFIFWSMPSGLIIYWIMQNVLQVLHQLYINNKGKKEAA